MISSSYYFLCLSKFCIDGMLSIQIAANTVAMPQYKNILAIPKESAIKLVANNPIMDGNELTLSNNANTRPRYFESNCVCINVVNGPEKNGTVIPCMMVSMA